MDCSTGQQAVWYYNSSDQPWTPPSSESTSSANWTRYSDSETDIIENAYRDGRASVCLDRYGLDLRNFTQVRFNDRTKQRPIKREVHRALHDPARSDPLSGPLSLQKHGPASSNYGSYDSWCPFMKAWFETPMGKRALVDLQICIEPCAQGIIQEALDCDDRSRAKAAEMAKELRRYWGKSRREVSALCMAFYTSDTFLYFVLNKALRECDLTKLDTLGPYAYLLGEHAHFGVEYCGTVYRGAQLIPDHIEEYKRALGTWKSWPAFSSTCKIRCAAETYGNTLFIIEITAARDERSLSFDVSGISNFSQEEEVIIMPGTCFLILSVDQDPRGNCIIQVRM